jgi:hypothetical protein
VRRPPLPAPLRRALLPRAGHIEAWRTRPLSDRERWERALPTEVGFWDTYLGDMAVRDSSGYRNPDYSWADEPVYHRVIEQVEGDRIAALDVGAGP